MKCKGSLFQWNMEAIFPRDALEVFLGTSTLKH